ncbi:Ku protein [Streptomyces mirabilis]|uniref:Ku protein n=1 Tax=Streptomyces mirabilis TaxID=68239 RepID=UPI0036F07374
MSCRAQTQLFRGVVAAKPYLVLRHALERSSRVAVARYAWHGRERLGLLRVRGDVIALHGLLWPDEIRDPAALVPPPVQLDEDKIDEAVALIEAKQEDRQLPQSPAPAARPGQLVDLMAALQESVSKARAARGETDVPPKKAPSPKASLRAAGRTGGRRGTPAR